MSKEEDASQRRSSDNAVAVCKRCAVHRQCVPSSEQLLTSPEQSWSVDGAKRSGATQSLTDNSNI